MRYQQIDPNEQLQKYVRYFWVLEDDSLHFSQKTFKIMSDGLPGLIFQKDKKSFLNKDGKELPQLFLYGQTTRYKLYARINRFQSFLTFPFDGSNVSGSLIQSQSNESAQSAISVF